MNRKILYPSKRGIHLTLVLILILFSNTVFAAEKETITFWAADSLPVTADLYVSNPDNAPFIILFHQAGWSRGEYIETAPVLNKLGFNCLAVDQRSGKEVNGIMNQTHIAASKTGKPTEYVHALPDMQAALDYIKKNYPQSKLIIWGSSYSSALAIKLASENAATVAGVMSFSPGEYFEKLGMGNDYITKAAKQVFCPVFITSKKKEASVWADIYKAIPSKHKQFFIPETEGNHGSRALWSKFEDSPDYWRAVKSFLQQYK